MTRLPSQLPDAFDEAVIVRVGGADWELRRVGSDSFLQIDGKGAVLELSGLSKFSGFWDEPELAMDGTTAVLAAPPTLYVAIGTAPLGLDDVTTGDYELTWFDLDRGERTEPRAVVLDGGEESLDAPFDRPGIVALFLRRTSR